MDKEVRPSRQRRAPVRYGDSESDEDVVVANHHVYADMSEDEEEVENDSGDEGEDCGGDGGIGGPRDYAVFGDVDDLRGAGPQTVAGPIKCATAQDLKMKTKPNKKSGPEFYQASLERDKLHGWNVVEEDPGPEETAFTGIPGLLPLPSDTENALYYMDLMCDPSEYQILALETNAYAERKRNVLQEGKLNKNIYYIIVSGQSDAHTLGKVHKVHKVHPVSFILSKACLTILRSAPNSA